MQLVYTKLLFISESEKYALLYFLFIIKPALVNMSNFLFKKSFPALFAIILPGKNSYICLKIIFIK